MDRLAFEDTHGRVELEEDLVVRCRACGTYVDAELAYRCDSGGVVCEHCALHGEGGVRAQADAIEEQR